MSSAAASGTHVEFAGRIGPNAITRLAEALSALEGTRTVNCVFRTADLEKYLLAKPEHMVDERELARLHRALRSEVGEDRARTVSWIAGQRTADYLLGHRIPRLVQTALKRMPSGLASRVLAVAIARNAWTFAGTGVFSARHGRPTIFTIENCPICRVQRSASPCCNFYAATFERLYSRLVNSRANVIETGCQAMGAKACTFAITW